MQGLGYNWGQGGLEMDGMKDREGTYVSGALSAAPLSAASASASHVVATDRSGSRRFLAQLSRVLVVDDDNALRRSLSRLFRGAQIEVSEAKTVAEGVDLLARDPELVITDVRLPDGSGRRVVEFAGQRRPAPLIVAISGLASAGEAFALAQCGARIYLAKPFAEQDLLDGIAEASSDSRAAPVISGGVERNFGENLLRFARRHGIPEREMALVRLATAGVPRARCPEMLGISDNTCKTLTRRLLQRCGARSVAQIPRLVLMGETVGADA
jgi:DNA-binding NarL/FixJ family response regulator